jgi:DNA-binding MarR family transcriptional regulator
MGNQPTGLRATNPGKAARLEKQLLSYDQAQELAHQAHALADPNRLILLKLISDAGQSCVGDLCLIAGMEQANTSRNLRILWQAGLLKRWVLSRSAMYRLTPTGERLLAAIIAHED